MYQSRYIEISHNISVEVKPVYLEDESSAMAAKHVFAYFIRIKNLGSQTVTLLRRYWEIKDRAGATHEIEGKGVIGRTPSIEPGDEHSYNSFCVLKSYRGSMGGYYTMETAEAEELQVRIPEFLLVSHLLN